MRHHRQVGMVLYSASCAQAMKQLDTIFSERGDYEGQGPEFRLLPETALGTPLSFPDAPRVLCFRIFLHTAVIAVRVTEMTDEEMRKSQTEEIWERFWMGEPDE